MKQSRDHILCIICQNVSNVMKQPSSLCRPVPACHWPWRCDCFNYCFNPQCECYLLVFSVLACSVLRGTLLPPPGVKVLLARLLAKWRCSPVASWCWMLSVSTRMIRSRWNSVRHEPQALFINDIFCIFVHHFYASLWAPWLLSCGAKTVGGWVPCSRGFFF